ncbi:hypothetical protein KP509_29G061800 [Ceratopteris richardii]|uniref:non-specific serine/threonine protein kinase n=1 Tax=Ceratopteris richardii TaxID=49495 RepID=A0A8T2R9A2_CERRI|nr:hypothetical protein KP509_29G061800 [Ceratopteris richardii]
MMDCMRLSWRLCLSMFFLYMMVLAHQAPQLCAVDTAGGANTDTQALLTFKEAIEEDPAGLLQGWGAPGATNSCEWRGIGCFNGRVTVLDVSYGGLVSILPLSALLQLDQLKVLNLRGNAFHGLGSDKLISFACSTITDLDLSSNNLTGTLPASSADGGNITCTSLFYLNVSRNSFVGPLSSNGFVSTASSISVLDLSYNSISGTLPPSLFSQCGNLSWLDISHNSLEGAIPEGVSSCSRLVHLDLSHNRLSSQLPVDIFVPLQPSPASNYSLAHLNVSFNFLEGELPDVFQSVALAELDLSSNSFIGSFPPSLSACPSLHVVNISSNSLTGSLPSSLSNLNGLRLLYLSDNNLTGTIPPELGTGLTALEELDLSANKLTGSIPASFSNLTQLRILDLSTNALSGDFAIDVVCSMPSLQILSMSYNNLTGKLPAEGLTGCGSLSILDLSANYISGVIPDSICTPQLRQLYLSDNALVGAIPEGLTNCTSLIILDLSCNLLDGPLPSSLPRAPALEDLMIWGNFLTGPLPDTFGMATHLRKLVLNINHIDGIIPPSIVNCSSLEWLLLSSNSISGILPPDLGNLPKLSILQASDNGLTGSIPASLGNSTMLIWIELGNNLLQGTIPPELAKNSGKIAKGTLDQATEFGFIKNVDRRCGRLGGLLEFHGIRLSTVFNLHNGSYRCNVTRFYRSVSPYYFRANQGSLEYLDLSNNMLSGPIPKELGTMTYLFVLALSHNALTGNIPDSLSNIPGLTILYLDHNMLTGPIPPALSNLGLLNQIDLSNNNLSGPIPETGSMPTMPRSVFANNSGLCGAPLPPCGSSDTDSEYASTGRSKPSGWSRMTIAISSASAVAIVMACMSCIISCIMNKQNKLRQHINENLIENLPVGSGSNSWNLNGVTDPLSINVAIFERKLRKLSFANLLEATNGFSSDAIIGSGGFGEVYKGTLEGGTLVAIKKLAHGVCQGDREFLAEMETIGKIKHRNLVPLIGYCKVGLERLLVYEFMEGGSLEKRLHGSCESGGDESNHSSGDCALSWDVRKRIALGTARGLHFLHHRCIPHIIHRDLKSSNVLLDDTLEARVSDFGMARLVSAADTHKSVSALVGTPGYFPPEYMQSFRCTTKGDVYSFGIVLLELITGRRPTCPTATQDIKPNTGESATVSTVTSGSEGENSSTTTAASGTPASVDGMSAGRHPPSKDRTEAPIDLVTWVKKQLRAGYFEDILDSRVFSDSMGAIIPANKKFVHEEMRRYLKIALWCVEDLPSKRPTMVEVMALFTELHQDHGLDSL